MVAAVVLEFSGNALPAPLGGRYNLMGNHEFRRVSKIGF